LRHAPPSDRVPLAKARDRRCASASPKLTSTSPPDRRERASRTLPPTIRAPTQHSSPVSGSRTVKASIGRLCSDIVTASINLALELTRVGLEPTTNGLTC